MSDVVAVDAQSGQPGLSQVERVVDTFVAPSKTFTDILRNTSWWLPFLLAVVVSIGVTYTVDRQIGFDRVAENLIHDNPKQEEKIQSQPPDQRAVSMHGVAAFTKYVTYATPVIILIISAIGALINWASFNVGLGAKTTFGQMFCVWMYASLPRLLSGLLALITVWFGGNAESFNIKNAVGTNPAYFLPDAAPWLKAALSFLDVIGIWNLILLVIGTSIVAKVSRGKAAAVVVGWWVIVLVLSVISAAVSG
jgi:Yip1 domain